MDDWLTQLQCGDRVLDIGSASGSFSSQGLHGTIVAIDEDFASFAAASQSGDKFFRVVCRSQELAIASNSVDLVVCNHALEHFSDLRPALREIRRVLKRDGRLYVSVPNGFGLCDSVYRWTFEGGGHVNRFRREELIALIESELGLRLSRWQRLYSSFSYLHGILNLLNAPPADLQDRLKQLAKVPPSVIKAFQQALYVGTRATDRALGTELAVYGWAFWFEHGLGPAVEDAGYVNVCMYCGAGHPAETAPRLRWRRWLCTVCQRENPLWCAHPPRHRQQSPATSCP